MKKDKEEKKFSFEGFSLKRMTDEEFEQCAEEFTEIYNIFVDSYQSGDPNIFMSKMGRLGCQLAPLILIRLLFGDNDIKKITKEEFMDKYYYLKDPELLPDLEEQIKRLSNGLNKFDNIGE